MSAKLPRWTRLGGSLPAGTGGAMNAVGPAAALLSGFIAMARTPGPASASRERPGWAAARNH